MVAPKIKIMRLLLAAFFAMLVLGCSSVDDTDDTDGTPPDPVTPAAAAAIDLTAASNTVLLNGSTTISATVYNVSGETMAGASVIFTVSNPVLASVTAAATTNATGVATATLMARSTPGNVSVSASVGSVNSTQNPQITISSSNPPATIDVIATPATLQVNQNATISAEVLDQNGIPVVDGTSVTFSVNNSSLGGMSSDSATTTAGFATKTFQALNNPGTVTITAATGSIQAQVAINIMQSPAQSLTFISADPQRIALAGTAGTTTSLVRFRVLGSGGLPLEGITVSLQLKGPNGGEYLNSPSISSDFNGFAEVILNSGSVAGPVTITGTITTSAGPFVTSSSVISIGGGVPSAKRFSVAATVRNLAGLDYANEQTEITAYLADRFGNYNVLEGTTVSFASEVGLSLLSSNVTLNAEGFATVMARTQPPSEGFAPEQVMPEPWEVQLQNNVQARYGVIFSGHPRNGWASVRIHTKGEEHFDDANANGFYDLGESFIDTADDPFLDYNDNNTYDGAASLDPEEIFEDSNSNGSWNGLNGAWDSNKNIFTNYKILLTGRPYAFMELSASTDPLQNFTLINGESKSITFLICDLNLNTLISGTKIDISFVGDGASLKGNTSWTLADVGASLGGLTEFSVSLSDTETAVAQPTRCTINVKVTWHGVEYNTTFSGMINLPSEP